MTVFELKNILENVDDDKMVIITEKSGGWVNIEKIEENSTYIMIEQEEDGLFHNS